MYGKISVLIKTFEDLTLIICFGLITFYSRKKKEQQDDSTIVYLIFTSINKLVTKKKKQNRITKHLRTFIYKSKTRWIIYLSLYDRSYLEHLEIRICKNSLSA